MYMSYLQCGSTDSADSAEAKQGRENPLTDLVKNVIKGLGAKGRFTEEEMCLAWQEAVGEEAARHSRPVSFKKTSIFVEVDRSSWLYELTTRKKDILKSLGARLKGKKFKEIRFRIGDIAARSQKRQTDEEQKR